MTRSNSIHSELADYYFFQLTEILNGSNSTVIEKGIQLFTKFKELLHELTGNENIFFSTDFARLIYALDNFNIHKSLEINIKKLYYILKQLKSDKSDFTEESFNECIVLFADYITALTGVDADNDIAKLKGNKKSSFFWSKNRFHFDKKIKFLQCVVISIDEEQERLLITAESSDDALYFEPLAPWNGIVTQCRKGSILNLIDVVMNEGIITTYPGSFVVLEPDYLFDATEIAEAYENSGFNPYALFIKRLQAKSISIHLVLGNIINTLFDYLISNPAIDFETAYSKALKEKPLAVFQIAKINEQNKIILREDAKSQFYNLQNLVKTLKLEKFAVEPSFISPLFGFQGRLDLLAEYHSQDKQKKDVYELKSGKPARIDYFFRKDGVGIKTGVYPNHFAQVTIYNLLLETCYRDRTGPSSIIYSRDNEHTLRNVPNYKNMKQQIVLARNSYLSLEREFLENPEIILNGNWDKFFEKSAPWSKDDYINLKKRLQEIAPITRKYYFSQLLFLLKEFKTGKLGNGKHKSGYSSLWKENLTEKKLQGSILIGLQLLPDESNFETMHLAFSYEQTENLESAFRQGDFCVIYPDDDKSEFIPQIGRLIKCSIKNIDDKKIIVSIRNKMHHQIFAEHQGNWILDYDSIDSLQKSILHALSYFLYAEVEKQNSVLGLSRPSFEDREFQLHDNLSDKQKDIIQKALNANDYFLVQGPPGTGKTKYVLASLVDTLINQTDENILLLAYTNRAVDEICSTVKSLELDKNKGFPLIRLGKKDSTNHPDITLPYLMEKNGINTVYKKLKKTRILVATVASILTYPEIFDFINFQTTIIDEASQITESNLVGIISRIPRFIMIADEKQLPPIVLQTTPNIIDEDLSKIYVDNLGNSLFERLLKCSKENNWNDAYSMLTHQARMHEKIMDFPDKYFYANKLKILDKEVQTTEQSIFHPNNLFLSKQLSEHRFIFLNSDIEIHSKYHEQEADAVIKIIQTVKDAYADNFNNNTIGIISPFRLQCATINKKMSGSERQLISVDTVEKFQGSQREIIVITMAVNNSYLLKNAQSLTTIDEQLIDRKLNVALTRAQSYVIVLGNEEILSDSIIYSKLIKYCKAQNSFYHISELLEN